MILRSRRRQIDTASNNSYNDQDNDNKNNDNVIPNII